MKKSSILSFVVLLLFWGCYIIGTISMHYLLLIISVAGFGLLATMAYLQIGRCSEPFVEPENDVL